MSRLLESLVIVGVHIEDAEANALARRTELNVAYLALFNAVNELIGRFSGVGARTKSTTHFLDTEVRVAARQLRLVGTQEIAALAAVVIGAE